MSNLSIASQIASNSAALTSIDLTLNSNSLKSLEKVPLALQKNNKLKELHVSLTLSDKAVSLLKKIEGSTKAIIFLDISQEGFKKLHSKEVLDLSKLITNSKTIKKIKLIDIFDKKDLKNLLAAAESNSLINFKELSIYTNSLDLINYSTQIYSLTIISTPQSSARELRDLFIVLIPNIALKKLYINNSFVLKEAIDNLAELIKKNNSINYISLNNNWITDKEALALSEAFAANKHIATIDLSHNKIEDAGALAIAKMLEQNTKIASIYLAHNCIGSMGGAAIAKSLQKNNDTLFILKLSHQKYEAIEPERRFGHRLLLEHQLLDEWAEGAFEFAKVLSGNTKISELGLAGNKISQKSAEALIIALKTNQTIDKISLKTTNLTTFGSDSLQLITDTFTSNKTITEIEFTYKETDRYQRQPKQETDLIENHLTRNIELKSLAFSAVEKNDFSTLSNTLQQGVSINGRNKEGNTLLHVALLKKASRSIVEELLQQGASTQITNNQDKTPDDIAIELGCIDLLSIKPLQKKSSEKSELPQPTSSQLLIPPKPAKPSSSSSSLKPPLPEKPSSEKTLPPQLISSEEQLLSSLSLKLDELLQQKLQNLLESGDQQFQQLLSKYEVMGREEFNNLLQQQKKELSTQLLEEKKSAKSLFNKEGARYRGIVNEILDNHAKTSVLTPELIQQIQKELAEKAGPELQKQMIELFQSQEYQTEVQNLQDILLKQIEGRQKLIVQEIIQAEQERKLIQKKTDPLYKSYEAKQIRLQEQQKLLTPESIQAFYTTIEKKLGAKFLSAMMLAEGMVKRSDSWGDKTTQLGADILGGCAQGVPFVGGVVSSLVNFGVAELGGLGVDYYYDRHYQKTRDSLIKTKDALAIAELIARRLSQSYSKHIKDNYLPAEKTAKAAGKIADYIYDYLKDGKLKSLAAKPIEEKVAAIVKYVEERGKQERGLFWKKGTFFDKKVEPSRDPSSDSQKVEFFEKKLTNLEIEIRAKKLLESKITALTPETTPKALTKFKEKAIGINPTFYRLERKGKNLHFSLSTSNNSALTQLKALKVALTEIFEKSVINDFDIEGSTLIIMTDSTMDAKDLEDFLKQCGFN